MHNFPLDKVFGSWFVCARENRSFVHIRGVMSTCQHVKWCFACSDGSYVLGADVLLISWRVRRSRVTRSSISQILVCKGTWTLSPHPPTRTPTSPQDMIRVLCWCEDRNMNYMNVITRPHCTPRHDQGAVLVCAGEHELYYSTHPAHRAAPHPNPNLRWLGARGCMLVACADESFLACADACSWRVQMSCLT